MPVLDLMAAIEEARTEAESWRKIPWLDEPLVDLVEIERLVGEWRNTIQPWLPAGTELPTEVEFVENYEKVVSNNPVVDAAVKLVIEADDAAIAAKSKSLDLLLLPIFDSAMNTIWESVVDVTQALRARLPGSQFDDLITMVRGVLWHRARWFVAGKNEKTDIWSPLVAMFHMGVLPLGCVEMKVVAFDWVRGFVVRLPLLRR